MAWWGEKLIGMGRSIHCYNSKFINKQDYHQSWPTGFWVVVIMRWPQRTARYHRLCRCGYDGNAHRTNRCPSKPFRMSKGQIGRLVTSSKSRAGKQGIPLLSWHDFGFSITAMDVVQWRRDKFLQRHNDREIHVRTKTGGRRRRRRTFGKELVVYLTLSACRLRDYLLLLPLHPVA